MIVVTAWVYVRAGKWRTNHISQSRHFESIEDAILAAPEVLDAATKKAQEGQVIIERSVEIVERTAR